MNSVQAPSRKQFRTLVVVAGIVLVWFALAEVASWAWYASHESKFPRNPVPASGEEVFDRLKRHANQVSMEVRDQEVGATAMEMLKCAYGRTVLWSDGQRGNAVTVLKWSESSVVGGVESMHNPGTCLRAAGWNVESSVALGVQNYCGVTCEVTRWKVSQGPTHMLAYSTVFRRYSETAAEEKGGKFWNNTRLRSVISGRRDAPVMILLAYLPDDPVAGDEPFQRLMKSIFCKNGD